MRQTFLEERPPGDPRTRRSASLQPNQSTLRTISLFAIGLALILALPSKADQPDYNDDVKVTKLLRTSTNVAGQQIVYPHDAPAEASILLVEIPPGKQTGWHVHPVPLFGYVLSGTLTVKFSGGENKILRPGDALAEAVNIPHNGINEGTETVKLIIFVAGEKNVPFTVKSSVGKAGTFTAKGTNAPLSKSPQ
jgi:quercetin dioxygenase-like cupin family protein